MTDKKEPEEMPQTPPEAQEQAPDAEPATKKWTPPYTPGLPAWKRFGYDRAPGHGGVAPEEDQSPRTPRTR